MKVLLLSLLVCLTHNLSSLNSHAITGKWKTIDDESGKAVSVVEVFESKGRIYGRIIELLNPKDRDKKCVNCTGEDHNKPVLGLTVIKGLTKDGAEYNGRILDPKSGKIYKCVVELQGQDKLKVRGYIGVSLLGRTQVWERVK